MYKMENPPEFAISCNHLHKSYGEVVALRDISMEVKPGEIYGIIGPDGAGKTTLFRILTTLILADKGDAQVMHYDVVKDYKMIRNHIGYMPGKFSLYQDLTVEENINFFATVFNTTVAENYHLVKEIYSQLEPFKNRRAGKLSGGMKQKLALSCALIHKPDVLFLDEPTTGVDPVSRKEFWEMLRRLKDRGIAILVSTPYMDEATLCERIALIQNGNIMSVNTPEEIVNAFPLPIFEVKSANLYQLLLDLRTFKQTHSVHPFGEFLHFTPGKIFNNTEIALKEFLKEKGHSEIVIRQTRANIEDCFMEQMNQSILKDEK